MDDDVKNTFKAILQTFIEFRQNVETRLDKIENLLLKDKIEEEDVTKDDNDAGC